MTASLKVPPTASRPLVAHVVYRFDTGGLENGLANLIDPMHHAGAPTVAFRLAPECWANAASWQAPPCAGSHAVADSLISAGSIARNHPYHRVWRVRIHYRQSRASMCKVGLSLKSGLNNCEHDELDCEAFEMDQPRVDGIMRRLDPLLSGSRPRRICRPESASGRMRPSAAFAATKAGVLQTSAAVGAKSS